MLLIFLSVTLLCGLTVGLLVGNYISMPCGMFTAAIPSTCEYVKGLQDNNLLPRLETSHVQLVQDDVYYALLVPLTIPVTIAAVWQKLCATGVAESMTSIQPFLYACR